MSEDTEDKASKTEEPTERKLRQAREKGDVASSREAGNMMSVLALFTLVAFVLPVAGAPLLGVLRGVFETAGQVTIGAGGEGIRDVGQVTWALSRGIGVTMTPVLAVLLVCAFAGIALQGEVVVAAERIKPKWSKLSPLAGLKRLVSAGNLVEFAKSLVKVLVVGTIALTITFHAVMQLADVEGLVPEQMPGFARRAAMQILMLVTVLLAFVTVADVLWKRFEWRRKQRMSFREVKDEMKETEGDPHIKGKRQAIQREKSRQRMSQAVPRATVILTNPTHYAVALRYEGGADDAPVCVAKGADLMAAQIRRLAREAGVPIIENRPLARALYEVARIDREIPVEHWEAVAAIIAYVLDLGRNVRRDPPKGSSLRYGD
ncbi:flagellar biosynthesis protein FlhB [Pseudooceanicola nanhaiensis]|jgi:flagellar biosynthetic protein FlhB|uniref:flagellar biosynthesis protein FlhB n=1 Tax=Pseudooceanicola nanhaiensis TaxID=375761 RepID=UPI003515A39C